MYIFLYRYVYKHKYIYVTYVIYVTHTGDIGGHTPMHATFLQHACTHIHALAGT